MTPKKTPELARDAKASFAAPAGSATEPAEPSYQAWLDSLALGCECDDGPCAGCQQGALCDKGFGMKISGNIPCGDCDPCCAGHPEQCAISPISEDEKKRTFCHCGKPLNENGLCWCCDPISTCWPQ